MVRKYLPLLSALFLSMLFLWSAPKHVGKREPLPQSANGRVVISAPVQALLFAGDRFLAANLEAIRAATTTLYNTNDTQKAAYRVRSHQVVSELNPCHEDNYYLGNAVLSWGGMQRQGTELLARATKCRFWDEIPPFFLGFNQYFFFGDNDAASRTLEMAATRATNNAAALKKMAVMLKVEQMDDDQMAVNYLRGEVRKAADPKLKHMLAKRLKRLEGLIVLRKAQKRYESLTKSPLKAAQQLIRSGIIEQFPTDPLGLGYDFKDGEFRLRELRVQGLEDRR